VGGEKGNGVGGGGYKKNPTAANEMICKPSLAILILLQPEPRCTNGGIPGKPGGEAVVFELAVFCHQIRKIVHNGGSIEKANSNQQPIAARES
jgi:hypothetical protein